MQCQTKKFADVIIPRGAENEAAIEVIAQKIFDYLQNTCCLGPLQASGAGFARALGTASPHVQRTDGRTQGTQPGPGPTAGQGTRMGQVGQVGRDTLLQCVPKMSPGQEFKELTDVGASHPGTQRTGGVDIPGAHARQTTAPSMHAQGET